MKEKAVYMLFPDTISFTNVFLLSNNIYKFISDGYFDLQQVMCFCEACHKLRGDDLYHKRGDPPRDYALPYGWCRFVLRQVLTFLPSFFNFVFLGFKRFP